MVVGDGSFNVGQLAKLDWKLSMACSSNNCKNLDAPTVTLKFHLKDESYRETTKTVEMTLTEFQNFSKQVKEAKSVLSTT